MVAPRYYPVLKFGITIAKPGFATKSRTLASFSSATSCSRLSFNFLKVDRRFWPAMGDVDLRTLSQLGTKEESWQSICRVIAKSMQTDLFPDSCLHAV